MRLFIASSVVCLAVSLVQAQSAPLHTARRPVRGQYIVVMRSTGGDPLAMATETAAIRGGRVGHVYAHALRGFSIRLPDAALRALQDDPRVEYIEQDGEVTGTNIQSSAPWGLDRIDQAALPLDGSYSWGSEGAGVVVHVIDSGVRTTHVEFGGRAFVAADYVDDDGDGDPNNVANDDADPSTPDGADCNGHGTHVAGIIGGTTYGVAKGVTLHAHRVLGCAGSGTISAVIAAVDAVTASVGRPAVANMSLGGSASTALDNAVANSIKAGVVYAVAAGNSNTDASTSSPARVAAAITVGATTSSDSRASYSNYGAILDLFAPGSSIRSASYSDDVSSVTMSGTSMATPHVAGVAALYLAAHPTASPAAVRDALVAQARPVVTSAGTGSTDRLLYSGFMVASGATGTVTVSAPNSAVNWGRGSTQKIAWTHDLGSGAYFRVDISRDNGLTYTTVGSAVKASSSSAGSLDWMVSGPNTTAARVRVTWTGGVASDVGDSAFTIADPYIALSGPASTANWGFGSRQRVRWKTNLGASDVIALALSADGGASYAYTLANGTRAGALYADVIAPALSSTTAMARVKATWANAPSGSTANSVSASNFIVAPPFITVKTPNGGDTWAVGTSSKVTWTCNIGGLEKVRLEVSLDGGATYPIAAASSTPCDGSQAVTPQSSWRTSNAKLRITWTAKTSVADTSDANFKIQ